MPSAGIQTRSSKKRPAANPRLRPRGYWDRQNITMVTGNLSIYECFWTRHYYYLYINYQLLCTDYYLFMKYYSPVHVSILKSSSSGGYSCTHAAYGTVTLYGSSWWPSGTQLEFSLKLCPDRPPGTLIESDITICCMCKTVSSWRWALEARNM